MFDVLSVPPVMGKGNCERMVLPRTPLLELTMYQHMQMKMILKKSRRSPRDTSPILSCCSCQCPCHCTASCCRHRCSVTSGETSGGHQVQVSRRPARSRPPLLAQRVACGGSQCQGWSVAPPPPPEWCPRQARHEWGRPAIGWADR